MPGSKTGSDRLRELKALGRQRPLRREELLEVAALLRGRGQTEAAERAEAAALALPEAPAELEPIYCSRCHQPLAPARVAAGDLHCADCQTALTHQRAASLRRQELEARVRDRAAGTAELEELAALCEDAGDTSRARQVQALISRAMPPPGAPAPVPRTTNWGLVAFLCLALGILAGVCLVQQRRIADTTTVAEQAGDKGKATPRGSGPAAPGPLIPSSVGLQPPGRRRAGSGTPSIAARPTGRDAGAAGAPAAPRRATAADISPIRAVRRAADAVRDMDRALHQTLEKPSYDHRLNELVKAVEAARGSSPQASVPAEWRQVDAAMADYRYAEEIWRAAMDRNGKVTFSLDSPTWERAIKDRYPDFNQYTWVQNAADPKGHWSMQLDTLLGYIWGTAAQRVTTIDSDSGFKVKPVNTGYPGPHR